MLSQSYENLWQKYLARREKARQRHLEWWKKKRAKGHPRFVLSVTFLYGASMTIFISLFDYYFDGDFNRWEMLSNTLKYFIIGFIIGAVTWWDSERKYQKYLKSNTDVSPPAK